LRELDRYDGFRADLFPGRVGRVVFPPAGSGVRAGNHGVSSGRAYGHACHVADAAWRTDPRPGGGPADETCPELVSGCAAGMRGPAVASAGRADGGIRPDWRCRLSPGAGVLAEFSRNRLPDALH